MSWVIINKKDIIETMDDRDKAQEWHTHHAPPDTYIAEIRKYIVFKRDAVKGEHKMAYDVKFEDGEILGEIIGVK